MLTRSEPPLAVRLLGIMTDAELEVISVPTNYFPMEGGNKCSSFMLLRLDSLPEAFLPGPEFSESVL